MGSRIGELATIISSNTVKVETYLQSKQLPMPSFEVNGPIDLNLPPELEKARIVVIEASIELKELLEGPVSLTRPAIQPASLQGIYKFEIAQKVPIDGEISYQELAKLCDLYEPDLRRIVRFAICFHRCFKEPRKGFVAHSAVSRLIAEDLLVRDGVGQLFDTASPAFAHTIEAAQRFKSQEPNETGFNVAFQTDQNFFAWLETQPDREKRFANSMAAFAKSNPGVSPNFLIDAFPWESLGKGTVVDIGGSNGHVSISLARAFPSLNFVVQDRPTLIEKIKDGVPEDVSGQVRFMAHDFFTEQPLAADVYFFRYIFHNWSDTYVIKILHQLIPRLKAGNRIIAYENILPEPNVLPLSIERHIRWIDISMWSLCNARERDRDDWEAVFREADPRFKLSRAETPEGSALGIVEVIWEG